MSLSIKPSLNIVATILAKNESDIIGHNIEHHIEHGVNKFIITDNNSSDNTKKIAEQYPEVVEIIDEPGTNHNQSIWVTKMSQIACKLKPDWIIHLDADELWCNLLNLRKINGPVASCEKMLLHPPVNKDSFNISDYRYYLNFDNIPIPQESKIAHRPDANFVIEHGNHSVKGISGIYTTEIYRHHYPIRTLSQWEIKSNGHLALQKRNSCCERWEKWHNLKLEGNLSKTFNHLCDNWKSYCSNKCLTSFINILEHWATPDMIMYFKNNPNLLPEIGEWPKNELKIL